MAIALFLISFFLPAYSGDSGFFCFKYCWDLLLGNTTVGDSFPRPGWFYYSGFALANILFIALVLCLFLTKKHRELRLIISVVCFFQVTSWFALNIVFGKPSQITEFNVGYYAWLIAYGLLVVAHLLKTLPPNKFAEPNSSPDSPFDTNRLGQRPTVAKYSC